MGETAFIIIGIVAVPLVIMVILALFLLNGKGAFLIAGYNTMGESDKAKFDEKALCHLVGWMLIAVVVCILLFTVGICFEMMGLVFCGIVLTLVVTIGGIAYANTGKRFRKSAHSEEVPADEKPKSLTSKATVICVTAALLIALIMIGVLNYQGEKDPTVSILDDTLQIEAMYGVSIEFSDVTDIILIEKSMSDIGVGRRTNGYGGIGEALKGNFESESLGETLLFVQSKSSPTICIERADNKDVYISFHDRKKTEQLYREICVSREG